MKFKIGSKYKEKKSELRERIRKNKIKEVEIETGNFPEHFGCYFCGAHIDGKVHILVDEYKIKEYESESLFFIDDICYRQAKIFFYYNEIPFSLN